MIEGELGFRVIAGGLGLFRVIEGELGFRIIEGYLG